MEAVGQITVDEDEYAAIEMALSQVRPQWGRLGCPFCPDPGRACALCSMGVIIMAPDRAELDNRSSRGTARASRAQGCSPHVQ